MIPGGDLAYPTQPAGYAPAPHAGYQQPGAYAGAPAGQTVVVKQKKKNKGTGKMVAGKLN